MLCVVVEESILKIEIWLHAENKIDVDFPDETEGIIKNKILLFAR
jgi:hypothetical protein